MTMFTTAISTLTDAEIAADIATCRTILRTGHVNGILLDGDSEGYYRGWLECAEEEQTIRADDLSDAMQTRIDPTEYERAA